MDRGGSVSYGVARYVVSRHNRRKLLKKVCPGGEGLGLRARGCRYLVDIPAGWAEVVDQDLTVDNGRPDVGAPARVDDRGVRIRALGIDQDQVGALADL